jgi:SAM-dependent methyltransferase
MNYIKKTIQAYEDIAEQYAERNIHKLSASAPLLEDFTQMLPGKKILEIGFGEGTDAKWFINRGFDYTGVDPVTVFNSQGWARKDQITILRNDILEVDFPEESFDGIWAMAIFLHLKDSDVKKVLEKCYNWLKYNGILYVSLKEGAGSITREDGRFFNFFIKKRFLELAKGKFALSKYSTDKARSWNTGKNNWLNFYLKKI